MSHDTDLNNDDFPISGAGIDIAWVFSAGQKSFWSWQPFLCARNMLAYFAVVPGTIVCFLVLVAYTIIAFSPNARKILDRVSFRLLVYSLISKWVFNTSVTEICQPPVAFYSAYVTQQLRDIQEHGVNLSRSLPTYALVLLIVEKVHCWISVSYRLLCASAPFSQLA